MFESHNGHILAQFHEAHTSLKQSISDFEHLLALTKKVNVQNIKSLGNLRQEIAKLKEAQL